jgi:hypothetical protein
MCNLNFIHQHSVWIAWRFLILKNKIFLHSDLLWNSSLNSNGFPFTCLMDVMCYMKALLNTTNWMPANLTHLYSIVENLKSLLS